MPYLFQHLTFNVDNCDHNQRPLIKIDHGIACNDDYLYIYGESIIEDLHQMSYMNNKFAGTLWKYDLVACRWVKLKCNLPHQLKYSSIILSGNLIIIHGGIGARFSNESNYKTFIGNVLKENDPNGIKFDEINCSSTLLKSGYGQPIIMKDQFIYSVTGMSNFKNEMDVYRLDLETKKWEILSKAYGKYLNTKQKFKHDVAYYNECLFMFGGTFHDARHDIFLNTFQIIHIFDLKINKWKYIPTISDRKTSLYPSNRIHHGWIQCRNQHKHVYVIGGYDKHNFFQDLWCFNLSTLEWSSLNLCRLPSSIFFLSSAITPSGKLYYCNGMVYNRDSRVLEQNNSLVSAWVIIPKLKIMSWNAILYFFKKQLFQLTNEDLASLGLLPEYCNRIAKAKLLLKINV
ncbi:kelch domain-containing protein 10-like isoform X2 [Daktulosphaira vitifoliae]|uniref:kelch domain-containing protein 10-like isoform X2 n=1 Tax=Daktulosphaira vitifoliae TaxID=58002 RepID=UPI0021A9CBC6|nr:kelch domain-containing protein 10-like isoform X2 [Daktulosphaira vitifoliae]XP_050532185.1 kelch domain-containing protein 10-like isoform X2 [Daktulosphaira vitifoliae]XP_050532186.1 kelch domain-containing protein 10-like isoform X2 [Daktulosphaira vitifoliae]XP_050532187.1 kelch domain-containing protein 10-like isoform X2 [Daktulosphaira vitifoliae]